MCGILGFAGPVRKGQWGQTHDLLTSLLVASERRGKDATGFAALTDPRSPYNGKVIVRKRPEPARQFVQTDHVWASLRQQRCSIVIGHTRMATNGSPKDARNNHPHSSRDQRFHLIHNGIIADHRDIATKMSLSLDSDCDSEILLRLVEASDDPALGLEDAMELEGSMAVAVLDTRLRLIWLAHNEGRDLWLLRLKDDRRCFFASTGAILIDAFEAVFGRGVMADVDLLAPLATLNVHALTATGKLVALNEESPISGGHRALAVEGHRAGPRT